MVWVGLIFFVNFVQLVVLQTADEQSRGFLHKAVVPSVAWWFRHASTVTVVTGVLLLVLAGYLLPSLVYGTERLRAAGAGAAALGRRRRRARHVDVRAHVHLAEHAGRAGPAPRRRRAPRPRARARVVLFARLNLVLSLPVVIRHGGGGAPLLTWPRAAAAPRDDAVIASARSGEPDRYLAALLAPPAARDALLALAAFSSELARVPRARPREPAMGEIRLQWWRDALAAPARARAPAIPWPTRVRAAMHRYDLPARRSCSS